MKLLFWIVALPLLFIAAFFAIANRETVTIDLWPVAGQISVPLFLALVAALYVGFLFGAVVAWWAGRTARARAREQARRAERLQHEVAELKARLDAANPQRVPPPSAPPSLVPPPGQLPANVGPTASAAWPAP